MPLAILAPRADVVEKSRKGPGGPNQLWLYVTFASFIKGMVT